MEIKLISDLEALCRDNYNDKTYNHAHRVARYVTNNPVLRGNEERYFAYCVALCHDLIEDTGVKKEDISIITTSFGKELYLYGCSIADSVSELTHDKENESYVKYIQRVRNSGNLIAYVVKLADMKDHFMQKETLTDKFKEKYLNAIGELL